MNRRQRTEHMPLARRGVTGVLAMMFLVMFSSLALAMAIVSQGNLRTAETHLRVTRALGAVDTGMELAASRLNEAASRFLVAKGEIEADYATDLWYGTWDDDPEVTVLPPPDGREETVPAGSIAEALAFHHAEDDVTNISGDILLPTPPEGWVVTGPIGIARDNQGRIVTAAQITYVPPDALGRVLVVVTGYDWDYDRGAWVTRTAQQYFNINKTVRHAILGPSRMMIGRNVQITGPLGIRYDSDALDSLDGPPLVVRSDFKGLDDELDEKLDDLYDAIMNDDVDGDNRLRSAHLIEGRSLDALNLNDYDGDDAADTAFVDMTSDNIVDEFDVFLSHFDENGDGQVVLSSTLTAGTTASGRSAEFDLDDALAMLIDSGLPDRNGNGRWNGHFINGAWDWDTFRDNNGDGVLDSLDSDADDVTLGYRDGVLDYRDRYAKVRGSAYFSASRQQWEDAHNEYGVTIDDYQQYVEGAIIPPWGDEPVVFEASESELPEFTTDHFAAATQALIDAANGQSFQNQVEAQNGVGWTAPRRIESAPYGSPSPADWYSRPVYEDMIFRDVVIPMGTNGLFINCQFIGVTRVETYIENSHPSWTFYGQQERDPVTGQLVQIYPPPPAESASALDTSYSTPGAPGYDALPEPFMVSVDLNGDGSLPDQCTDTKLIANNIRFHDCTFIGSIVSDTPVVYTHVRNKLQFTGATRFLDEHPEYPDDDDYNPEAEDLDEIAKSSMMLPNYSVDIGANNSPPSQDVNLKGAIVAGVLDVRGNATIDGVLLLSFEPVYGQAPLELYGDAVGNPAGFNITLGYFGPEDGDYEGVDLTAMTDLDADGDLDVGWDSARDATGALIPTAGWDGTHDDAWYDGIADEDTDLVPGDYVRRPVEFNGFGEIRLNWDPTIILPDGLASPISIEPIRSTYSEGRFAMPDEGGEEG